MTTAHDIDWPAVLAERLTTTHPDVLRELMATFIHTLMGAEADVYARLRGGLTIDYDHYRWAQDERKIIINLGHPVVKLAKDLPDDEATYRRLIWEIAFTAYAVALADLQFERDPARDSYDATFEIRAALRRVWAHAGALYAV